MNTSQGFNQFKNLDVEQRLPSVKHRFYDWIYFSGL